MGPFCQGYFYDNSFRSLLVEREKGSKNNYIVYVNNIISTLCSCTSLGNSLRNW